MRHEKLLEMLELARMLAANAEGMTLDQMCQGDRQGRRTTSGCATYSKSFSLRGRKLPDGASKRFRISGGLDGSISAQRPRSS